MIELEKTIELDEKTIELIKAWVPVKLLADRFTKESERITEELKKHLAYIQR